MLVGLRGRISSKRVLGEMWRCLFCQELRKFCCSPTVGSLVDENVSLALSCELGCGDCECVGSASETIGEEQDVGFTSRHDREGAEVVDADGNAGPFGQKDRHDGPPDRQPRDFPCLAFQALVNPPPGADAHTNPPVKAFEYLQSCLLYTSDAADE